MRVLTVSEDGSLELEISVVIWTTTFYGSHQLDNTQFYLHLISFIEHNKIFNIISLYNNA